MSELRGSYFPICHAHTCVFIKAVLCRTFDPKSAAAQHLFVTIVSFVQRESGVCWCVGEERYIIRINAPTEAPLVRL